MADITVVIEEQNRHAELLKKIIANQEVLMAGQASVDAAVAAIATAVSTLAADVSAIAAQIAAGGGGTPVVTDALDAAVGQLVSAVNSVTALVPGSVLPG